MSMPSNRSLRVMGVIRAILGSLSGTVKHSAPSGSKGIAGRGKNHADKRRGYNKVKHR